MKNKMLIKLAASFAAVMLLFTFVLGSVFLTLFRNHTIDLNRTTMEEKAISIADTLASFQGNKGSRGGKGGYGAYLHFLDELAMAEVWIVDADLNLLTGRQGSRETNYEALPENTEVIVARVFAGELTYGEEFSGLLGTPSLTVGAPVISENKVVGAVLLHSPVSGVNAAVRQGIKTLVTGTGVALLLSGIAAALMSYALTHPLAKMKTAALQIADGDYTAKTGITQRDEIGQLASVMDELAHRLYTAKAERAALDKLRENFVTNVSHELRTPVAVLRGSVELLRDGTVSTPDEVREYYDQMLCESRHLERLVNDLLDLSRLQDEGFHLEFDEVNLCDIVRDAARAIRRTAQSKKVSIEVSCPNKACVMMGDYDRIRQLLLILLDNAVKFSAEHSLVEVALVEKDGFILSVTDYGMGIPKNELIHIFDRFHKVSSPANKNGSGLGLAIAKEIAVRHNAKLTADSACGKTTFSFCTVS